MDERCPWAFARLTLSNALLSTLPSTFDQAFLVGRATAAAKWILVLLTEIEESQILRRTPLAVLPSRSSRKCSGIRPARLGDDVQAVGVHELQASRRVPLHRAEDRRRADEEGRQAVGPDLIAPIRFGAVRRRSWRRRAARRPDAEGSLLAAVRPVP